MAHTNELLSPDVRALITRQRGVLAAAQAAACGLPRETLRMRVSRGLWQRVLPGVYLLQCSPPNPVQRALAAQVYAGESAIVTGPAALRLHGIGDVVSGLWDDIDGWATWASSGAAAAGAIRTAVSGEETPALGSALPPASPHPHGSAPPAAPPRLPPTAPPPRPPANPSSTTPPPPVPPRPPGTAPRQFSPRELAAVHRSSIPSHLATRTRAIPAQRRPPDRTAAAAASSGPASMPSMPNGVDAPAWRVHILVPHGQRRQNIEYVRISRTTRLPEPVLRYGLKLAPPARAALDACSWCLEAPDDVTAEAFVETVVRATVSAGLADLDDLESELEQAPRRHTRSLRQALERARVRERALASRRLFEGLGYTSALGLMRRVAIYGERKLIAVAEALWPHRALVLTIDAEPNAVAELTRLGFAVIQLSAHDVADNTAEIMERIAAVLAARPEATLPRGVALLPLGQHESDAAAEGGGLPGRVQLASTTSPTLPPWSGLRVRGPAFSGAF